MVAEKDTAFVEEDVINALLPFSDGTKRMTLNELYFSNAETHAKMNGSHQTKNGFHEVQRHNVYVTPPAIKNHSLSFRAKKPPNKTIV